MQLVDARIGVLQTRFAEITQEMYMMISKVEKNEDLDKVLAPIREQRDEIKKQLCNSYRQIDVQSLPSTYYHRVGILDEENRVDWMRYQLPGAPEVRASAPAILSPRVQL
jgi:hypothetical protein